MKILFLSVLLVLHSTLAVGMGKGCATTLTQRGQRKALSQHQVATLLQNHVRSEVLSQCEGANRCSIDEVHKAVGTAFTDFQKKTRSVKGIAVIVGMYAGVVTILSYLALDESIPRYVIAPITMVLTPVLSAMTAPVSEWIASTFRYMGFGISTALESDPEIDDLRKSYESLWKVINAKLSENAQTGRNALNSALTQTMISLDAAWWAWNEKTSTARARAIDLVALAAIYMRKVFPDLNSNIELVGLIGQVYFSGHLMTRSSGLRNKIMARIRAHDKKALNTDYYQRLLESWLSGSIS